MSGVGLSEDGVEASTSGMMETTMMEGEEYYNPDDTGTWAQKEMSDQLCRICAKPNQYLIPIFEGEGIEHQLEPKIQKHLPIEVSESDDLPLQVCYQCASTLIAWNDLVIACIEADKKLRQMHEQEEEDEDDKGAEFFDEPILDSDEGEDPVEPSTSTPAVASDIQSDTTSQLKRSSGKAKKPKLKMTLVKSPTAGPSGLKTPLKKIASKAKEDEGQEATERYHMASHVSAQLPNCIFLETIKVESCENDSQMSLSKSVINEQDPLKEKPITKRGNLLNCGQSFSSNDMVHLGDKQQNLGHEVIENVTTADTEGLGRKYFTANVGTLLNTKSVAHNANYSSNADDTNKLYSCTACENSYVAFGDLLIHIKFECSQSLEVPQQEQLQGEISNANADICGPLEVSQKNPLISKRDILKHIRKTCTDNFDTTYSCSICDLENLNFNEVRSHVGCGPRVVIYDANCENEDDKTPLDSRQEQMHENLGSNKFSCHICSKTYSINKSLLEHIRKIHKSSFKCKICSSTFPSKLLHRNHTMQHNRKPRYECHICFKWFILRSSQIKHLSVTHNARPKYFKCKICHARFYTKLSVEKHVLKNHKPGNIKRAHLCSICGKSLSSASSVWVHEKSVHGTEPKQHTCEKCGKRFRFATLLKKHMSRHLGIKRHACGICGKKYFDKACMVKHELCHSDARPYGCKICDVAFKRRNNLRNHEIRVHCIMPPGKTVYPCSICGKEFISKQKELEHMNFHTGNCPFSCNECEKSFKTSASLYTHKWKIHSNKKKNNTTSGQPFLCDKCDKSYRTMATLEKHKKKAHETNHIEQTGDTTYTCNACEKSFTTKQSLQRHINDVHRGRPSIGERSFPCDLCDKTYNSKHSLLQHEKNIHLKDKNQKYTCSSCGKVFNNKGSMYSHSRIHVKSHTCKVCNKSFSWKSKYLVHLTIHSEEKPFACPTCDKTFRRKYELEVHSRTHTGAKPYPCGVCGRGFSQSSDRNKHQNKVHAAKKQP